MSLDDVNTFRGCSPVCVWWPCRTNEGEKTDMMPKCECCGRFMRCDPGAAWRMVYSGHPPTPWGEIHRCKSCVQKWGPFDPQHGIKPECSCGVFKSREMSDSQ